MSNPNPKFTATMILPKNGKRDWSNIMYGESKVPSEMDTGSPIVMASAVYEDGTRVLGGVLKSKDPTDYNIKFMWVFDKKGNQYPGWPIDTSDEEDFFSSGYYFSLTGSEEDVYLLKIVDAD